MALSACWIVKNEAEVLARSIESVKSAVDDIVVVDTGSTDNTVDIAMASGARVEHFEWINDFAAARNYALNLTKNHIAIVLDADEWFEPALTKDDSIKIEDLFDKDCRLDGLRLEMTNLRDNGQVISKSTLHRVIRKRPHMAYIGAIHERYAHVDGDNRGVVFIDELASWSIMHSGYRESIFQEKVKRNIDLLLQDVSRSTDSVAKFVSHFYIVREYKAMGKIDEALPYFQYILEHAHLLRDAATAVRLSFLLDSVLEYSTLVSERVSHRQIKNRLFKISETLYPQYPGSVLYMPYYSITYEVREDKLLNEIDDVLFRLKQMPPGGDTTYKQIEGAIAASVAFAAFRRGNILRALEYSVNALRNNTFNNTVFYVLLQSVKGQPPMEIAAFLNQVVGIDTDEKLSALTECTRLDGFLPVHSYYLQKRIQAGAANKVAETSLLLFNKRYDGALHAALRAATENGADVSLYILGIAICTDDASIVQRFGSLMPACLRAANAYFSDERLTELTDIEEQVLPLVYTIAALTEGLERAERFSAIYANFPKLVFACRAQYMSTNGMFATLADSVPDGIDLTDYSNCSILITAYCFAGRYQEAFVHIRYFLVEAKSINQQLLNNLLVIADCAQEPLSAQARKLYDKHRQYADALIDLGDVVKYGYAEDDCSFNENKELSSLTREDFERRMREDDEGRFVSDELFKVCEQAGPIFEQKRMFGMAVRCFRLPYCHYHNRAENARNLARVFRAARNRKLAKWFEEQSMEDVAEEAKSIYLSETNSVVTNPETEQIETAHEEPNTELPTLTQTIVMEHATNVEPMLTIPIIYPLDTSFQKIMEEVRVTPYQKILYSLQKKYAKLPQQIRRNLEDYFTKYPFWGRMNATTNHYEVLDNRARGLSEHWEDFLWLYKKLGDYRSRHTLFAFLNNWYAFDFETLDRVKERVYPDYFDLDIMRCGEDEVFVDLGAYTGDTVIHYINSYGAKYRRIYCYEVLPQNIAAIEKNLAGVRDIILCRKGASDCEGVLYLSEGGDASAGVLGDSGNLAVPTVAIDTDITEPVTFIKMDIEGSEQRALRGCAEQIRQNRPKLAICVYHNNEDIWKIPRMIEEICPGYRFYLRYHGGNLVPTEMALLAVYGD